MHDSIIKNTGNSRYLKSNILPDITHEELVALLRSGQFAFDFNGINELAFDQIGTPLNKSTLLSDETETNVFGNSNGDRTVSDALLRLASRLAHIEDSFRIAYGSYVGTGSGGAGNQNRITLEWSPRFIVINKQTSGSHGWLMMLPESNGFYSGGFASSQFGYGPASLNGNTVSWYATYPSNSVVAAQMNEAGATYRYIAIG